MAAKSATVIVRWTVPGEDTPTVQQAKTGGAGIARFSVRGVPGLYSITVVDVMLDDYAFDADNSVLTASIDTR
jgi:hypothetical protein